MPAPAGIITGISTVLDVVGVGFSIYDLANGDPTAQKLDELSRRIDALEDSIDQLGVTLMQELEIIQNLIPTALIDQAVADAQAARGELLRTLAVETPSEQQRLDTISSSEHALLRVLGQAGTILNGQNPESAIGLFGSLSYAVTVRLEVAHALENGAMGAQVLRGALSETAGAFRGIAEVIESHLPDTIDVTTTGTSRVIRFINLDTVREARFVTTAYSPYTDTTYTETRTRIYNTNQEFQRYTFDLANHRNVFEPRLLQRHLDEAIDLLRLPGIRTAADQLDALADGVQRTGTSGPDTLIGTDGNDLLIGLAGNDVLDGGGDGDVLYGGSGNDRLLGQGGHDVLDGGNGTDTLSGGTGDDRIFGGDSAADLRDVIYGGEGNDTAYGGAGNDEIRGDAGNDLLFGDTGADTLIGGTGNDTLNGGSLGDVLFGGDGDDFLNGGFGFDRLNGGAGADTFFHLGVADHGSDWIQDYNAAEGDVLQFGQPGATRAQFQINIANTPNAGSANVAEAFVIYRPTGQIIWALVDGAGQSSINLRIGAEVFDLMG
jgi:hypothetical protein